MRTKIYLSLLVFFLSLLVTLVLFSIYGLAIHSLTGAYDSAQDVFGWVLTAVLTLCLSGYFINKIWRGA